jgi:histidine triad (HIT) family protein
MTDCLFCKIANKELPSSIVYEDADVLAFLDIKPIHEGHTLVIPKVHSHDLSEIDPVDLQAVYATAQRVAQALLQFGAEGVNVTTNVKPASGQVIFHTHIHVIPRYHKDGLNTWPHKELSENGAKEWKEKLLTALCSDNSYK